MEVGLTTRKRLTNCLPKIKNKIRHGHIIRARHAWNEWLVHKRQVHKIEADVSRSDLWMVNFTFILYIKISCEDRYVLNSVWMVVSSINSSSSVLVSRARLLISSQHR